MSRKKKAFLSLVGVSLLALGLAFAMVYEPDRPVSALRARWAPPPSVFVELEGMSVHLRDEGPRDDAAPIVLLHGTSASLHTWDGWAVALGDRRVIRMDLPGFGLTGPMADGDYTIPRYVRFVVALLDRLGVERVVLAGNSLGGRIAWETALAHPGRVERLVLVDATGYAVAPVSIPIAFRVAQIPALRGLMDVILPRSLVASSVRKVYGDPSRVTDALVDRYFELTLREGNRRAVVERFRQSPPGEDHAARIARLTLPTLILWGARDTLTPPEGAERFHEGIVGSERVLFPELGHVPHEEDPAATVAVVRRFLSR